MAEQAHALHKTLANIQIVECGVCAGAVPFGRTLQKHAKALSISN
jgi:hypothetical protein